MTNGTRTRSAQRGCLVALGIAAALVLAAVLVPRVERFAGGRRVGIIRLEGEIVAADAVLNDAEKLADDPSVGALVLRVDSPGGEVGAAQEIYSGLLRIREESGKPLVASFGDQAASGGYYVACAAESVYANPGTLTGSIGVIMEIPDVGGVLRKVGVRMQVVKSGALKDVGSPYRPMTDEERRLLQDLIDDTYAQFVDAVARARRLPRERVLPVADGRVLSGRQALRAHLVDRLGDLEDAVRAAGRMAGMRGVPRTVEVRHRRTFWDLIADWLPWIPGSRLEDVTRRATSGTRLLYRMP